MKRLLAILVVATMLVSVFAMTNVVSAATADWVVNSVQGTATIDGVKDEAYDAFEPLVFETYGYTDGNGAGATLDTPLGYGYIMNDDQFVYFFMDVHDADMDNTSANAWERDSVEAFYMDFAEGGGGSKVQWRVCYDGDMGADSGTPPVDGDTCVVKVNDDGSGYVVEGKLPITEVLNNQIEMLLQINSASGGVRTGTVYASGHSEGDDGYQRNDRTTDYDCWMTLQLVGDHADTRVDPVPVAQEITVKNYQDIMGRNFTTQIFIQDVVSYSYWNTVYNGPTIKLGETGEFAATNLYLPVPADALTPELTNNYAACPKFNVQLSDGAMQDGDSEEFKATYSDITIKATGYEDVVVPGATVEKKLKAAAADWGMSGNSWEIELGPTVREKLGLTIEQFCKEYLPALTDINFTCTFETYNLNSIDTLNEFVANLEAIEQSFIDEDLKEYTDKVNTALADAQAANGDLDKLNDALKAATQGTNRARTEVTNAGYSGIALTYVEETLQPIVDQIQGMVDEATAAQTPAEPENTEPADTPDGTATEPSTTEDEGGSSTGLIVGIIVVVVVVIAVVAAVVLGKKKK